MFHFCDAKHIYGAYFEYVITDTSSMRSIIDIKFTMFRDIDGNGAPFDNPASFGIYRKKNDTWEFFDLVSRQHTPIELISTYNANPFYYNSETFYLEKTTYEFSVINIDASYDYMIVYQRCCRSADIINLINPDNLGFGMTLEIYKEAFQYLNTGPELINIFPWKEKNTPAISGRAELCPVIPITCSSPWQKSLVFISITSSVCFG